MKTEVKRSKLGGRGVFATKDIRKGEVIERAEIIRFKRGDNKHLEQTAILDYYFDDGKRGTYLALGNGSLYNHADDPNCFVLMNTDSKDRLVYMARKPIKKGEEITFHYYGLPGTKSEMWFKKKE